MFSKHLCGSALALTMALMPATQVAAESNAAAVLGGALLGAAIANGARNNQRKTTTTVRKPSVSSAQREANREVQRALNHFSYPAGTPDGVLGSRSRSAISQYQALLQFPVTGRLTEFERNILVTAYQRALIGGSVVAQTVSSHPQGMRGLLIAQRDEALGVTTVIAEPQPVKNSYGGLPEPVAAAVDEIARNSNVEGMQLIQRAGFIQLADMNYDGRTDYLIDTSVTGSGFWCNASNCIVRVFASTPSGYQRNDFQLSGATPASFTCQQGSCTIVDNAEPVLIVEPKVNPDPAPLPPAISASQPTLAAPSFAAQVAPPEPAAPNFFAATAATVSLSSYCSKINLVTASNGGFVTEATMVDPDQALGEQFCLARSYAIDEGETMLSKISGFTPAQIAQQCSDFAKLLTTTVDGLSIKARETVLGEMQQAVTATGMNPAQVEGTAKICLSVGYRTDDMDVALASALAIASVGRIAYDELIAHHLIAGIGVNQRRDLASPWYASAVNGLSGGAVPAFAAGQPERVNLLRKASLALNGQSSVAPAPAAPDAPAAGLASFAAQAVAAQ